MISSFTFLFGAFLLVVILAAAFFLWPSDPELTVARIRLDHIHVTARPETDFDISMAVELRIRNLALFALDYRSIMVSIGYAGGSSVPPRPGEAVLGQKGVSLGHANLNLNRMSDLARGSLPLNTVTVGGAGCSSASLMYLSWENFHVQ